MEEKELLGEIMLPEMQVTEEFVTSARCSEEYLFVKQMEELGIKNIKELYKLFEMILMAGAKVFKDGKVSLKDLIVLKDLLKSAKLLVDAVKDFKEIFAEARDLSSEEVGELADMVLGTIEKFRAELGA